MSVYTLKQNISGTLCGFTNMKSNQNISRSDWKCSPVHEYRLNQSKWTFCSKIPQGGHCIFPKVGEWVTRRDSGNTRVRTGSLYLSECFDYNGNVIRMKANNAERRCFRCRSLNKLLKNILYADDLGYIDTLERSFLWVSGSSKEMFRAVKRHALWHGWNERHFDTFAPKRI